MVLLSTLAAEAVALATVRAVRAARGVRVGELHIPAVAELP